MADLTVRISELPGADPLSGIEIVPLVQSGGTKTRSVVDLVSEGGLQDHIDAIDPHPQYTTATEAANAAPVQSVDGRTGNVVLSDLYEQKRLDNLTATTNPTVNNDSSQGYEVLSKWVNTATGEFWLCTNDSVGAANWQQATLTLDELGSAALVDMGTGPDQLRDNAENEALFLDNSEVGTAAFADLGTGPTNLRTNLENETLFTDVSETTQIAEDSAIIFSIVLG